MTNLFAPKVVLAVLVQVALCRAKFEFNHMIANGGLVKNEFQLVGLVSMQEDLDNHLYSIVSVSPVSVPKRPCAPNGGVVPPMEITVSFSSNNQSSGDWVGLYSPANADISTVVPVKLGYCSDSSEYLTRGTGSLRFKLSNTRSSVAVYMFRGDLESPVAVDKSESIVTFDDDNEPMSPRISADHGSRELRLTWSSKRSGQPTLKWGPVSGQYDHTVSAHTSHFNRSSLFAGPAGSSGWFPFGATHSAVFRGITALSGKRIYYQFGDEATSDYSCEFILDVPYLKQSTRRNRPTSILAFGDMGRAGYDDALTWFHYGRPAANTTRAITKALEDQVTDGIFFLGDISYASGYLAVWNDFLDSLSPVSSRVAILPVPGNHEADAMHDPNDGYLYQNSMSGGEGNTASAFLLPMPTPATYKTSWWSFDIDNMHLIGIDTEANISAGTPQHRWLEEDLKSVNRTKTPWVIMGGHRPMYVDSFVNDFPSSVVPVMRLMIKELEPLLWKYKVNLALWAHHHSYQRHSAVYDNTVVLKSVPRQVVDESGQIVDVAVYENPQATVHMVLGTGGADFNLEDPGETPELPFPGGDPTRSWYQWSEIFVYKYGFTRITALNRTHLDIRFTESSTRTVFDRALLVSYGNSPDSPNWNLDQGWNGDYTGLILAGANTILLCGITVYIFHAKSVSIL